MNSIERVDYQTHPSQYRHWKLSFEGPVATLRADFDENAGLRPGYKLKLNSYDLGVDIELNDAINRIRFEHPEVRTVVLTSAKEKVFCSGANIFMLGVSSHAWKVNFCKFTNETRNGLEDSSQHSGLKFLAAVNGACAGGGYELALACDEILLVDDRSSAVSLPEVPLLGVLPGTGGLTRVTDKRKVRHDLADIFCTTTEGVRGQKAKDWRLVDEIAKPAVFAQKVQERALALAAISSRPANSKGVSLKPLHRTVEDSRLVYQHVTVDIVRAKRIATFTVKAPTSAQPTDIAGMQAQGDQWYPLAMARELEDAILNMRTNELDIGLWKVQTLGDAAAVQAMDQFLMAHKDHWLVNETIGLLRRTFSRLDVSSRSLFALIEGDNEAGDAQDWVEDGGLYNDDSPYFSSGVSYPSLMAWTGTGWHTLWSPDANTATPTWGVVSRLSKHYRLWWGMSDGFIRSIKLRRTFHNPRAGLDVNLGTGIDLYGPTGFVETGRFDASMRGFNKIASHVVVYMDYATASEKMDVLYRTDINLDWTPLGTANTIGKSNFPFAVNDDGFSEGEEFNWIQFRLEFSRGDDNTVTPILDSFVLHFVKIPQNTASFVFTVPLPKRDWMGKTAGEIVRHLNALLEHGGFIKFVHGVGWDNDGEVTKVYRGKVAGISGADATGEDYSGARTVNFISLQEEA